MKILVCTDGSKNSEKGIEVAAKMVGDCSINEVGIIHVHESASFFPDYWHGKYPFSTEEEAKLKEMDKRLFEERKKYFSRAVKAFEKHHIPVQTIFRVGHAPEIISQVATEDGYDLIVIGRRGNSGIKSLFLGSVSNAVLQAAKTNVLIVK
ncbi:MAG TPA: universal stress protein [Firmicutes bacterium]|nr:universal stress protein [Bacillota bacterium]